MIKLIVAHIFVFEVADVLISQLSNLETRFELSCR